MQLDFHPDSTLNLVQIDSPYLQIPTIPTELERLTRKLESIDFAKVAGDLESIASGMNSFVNTDLSSELQKQLATTGPKLNAVLDGAATTVDLANAELPELARLVNANLGLLEAAIGAFEEGMRDIESLVDYDSATVFELNRALRELAQAGRALQQLTQSLEEHPESLIRGRRGEEQ